MGPRLRYLKRHCLFYTKYHKVGRAGIVGGGGHGRAKKEKDSRKKSKSWFLSPILLLLNKSNNFFLFDMFGIVGFV